MVFKCYNFGFLTKYSWSSNGRYLLSAARDWKCVLWDLKDGSRVRTIILDGPIWSADLHPHDQLLSTFVQ
jgi:COMPASS component SWD1